MITMLTGQNGYTFHAINRDGTAALCRANLKPRIFPSYGDDQRTNGHTVALYRMPGDPFSRSCKRERVNCLACQRKLAKITGEAFDAATAENGARTPSKYSNADRVTVGQRVYVYVGELDRVVAGNVFAIIGQNLDMIGMRAWITDDSGTHRVSLYRLQVLSVDQLRAAVEAPTPPTGPVPFPNANHMIGERVTLTSADPRQPVGTISGVIAFVHPAPHGAAHAVAVLESGWLVDLPASLVEATAPNR